MDNLPNGQQWNEFAKNTILLMREDKQNTNKEYFETVRSLALISGAVAAFCVPLLSSIENFWLALGVCLYLLVVILCTGHLLSLIEKSYEGQKQMNDQLVKPAQELSKTEILYKMDKLDESERDTIFKNSILSDYSKSSAITEKLSRDGEKPTYFIHYSFAIFLLATWSTMFSFAERYLIPKITTYIGHIMS